VTKVNIFTYKLLELQKEDGLIKMLVKVNLFFFLYFNCDNLHKPATLWRWITC